MIKILLSMTLIFSSLPTAHAEKIAIVTSYPHGAWSDQITQGIKSTLDSTKYSFEIEYFHSEFWLRQSKDKRLSEKKRLLDTILNVNPDILVLMDDEIIEFLGDSLKSLKKPLFFTGINSDSESIRRLTNLHQNQYSIALESYPCLNGIDLLKGLGIKAKNVGILTSDLPTSSMLYKSCLEELSASKHTNILFSLKSSFLSEWMQPKYLKMTNLDAIFILVPYGVNDVSGAEVPIEKVGKLLRANTSKPVIGILGVHTRIGLHAAFTVNALGLGKKTGKQILQYMLTQQLGAIDTSSADSFEVNENIWNSTFGKVPATFVGKRINSEALQLGR